MLSVVIQHQDQRIISQYKSSLMPLKITMMRCFKKLCLNLIILEILLYGQIT